MDWGGGALFQCSVEDPSCYNSCSVISASFDDSFCIIQGDLSFRNASDVLTIKGRLLFLEEHLIMPDIGGWDNDPDVFDVNQDGYPDLVVTDESYGWGPIRVFINDGRGNFTSTYVASVRSVDEIHENDADGDGDIDLFTVGHSKRGEDVVLLLNIDNTDWEKCVICKSLTGTCDGSLAGSGEAEGIYTGDLDNDGDIDIAVTHFNIGELYVLERVPEGTPGAYGCSDPNYGAHFYRKYPVSNPSLGRGWNVIISDFDRDGYQDIVATFDDGIVWYRNEGSLTFTPHPIETGYGNGYYGLATADIDNDGNMDIVVSLRNANVVKVLRNDGTGNFNLFYSAHIPHPMGVATSDLNLDGYPDIFVASYTDETTTEDSTIYILISDTTTGSFTIRSELNEIPRRSYFGVGAGDLDGDGDADLLVRAGTKSTREGLYWYSAELIYADSAKMASHILDINGPDIHASWQWDSILIWGRNLQLAKIYVRFGRSLSTLLSSDWQEINSIALCNAYGNPVDSIKCHPSGIDSMVQFIQYRIDLYSSTTNTKLLSSTSAVVDKVGFVFDDSITPVVVRESNSLLFDEGGLVKIFDIKGRLLKTVHIGPNTRIPLPRRPGIYIVEFRSSSGKVFHRKFIVR